MPNICNKRILTQSRLFCQCAMGHYSIRRRIVRIIMLVKERLIQAREKKGYSQAEIARRLGFTNNSMYCRIENGKKNASLSVATDIADILEVSLDWLLGKGK